MTTKKKKKSVVGYIITICVLGGLLATFVVLYSISASQNINYANSLENIYQKNFYDLVENINNTENKLAKTINATDSAYKAKVLKEVSKNAELAEISLNNLPYSINGVEQSVAFINQVSGYTQTLAKNIESGKSLSKNDSNTLEKIYDNVLKMKNSLAKFSENMWDDYSILNSSLKIDGDSNVFTSKLAQIKEVDVEFPTMIYDGPFSDTVVRKSVKGLKGEKVNQETARQNLLKSFANLNDADYVGDTNGRFETYNFSVKNSDGKEKAYIQMTKQGGYVLTATSYTDKKEKNLTMENAKEVAINFAKKNNIESPKVVWSDELSGNAYINIAPVVNNIIYYPDLVKVKVDLYNGDILGYEATAYYTNHIDRNLPSSKISKETAIKKVPSKFNALQTRLALIPLEYNAEILTYEVYAKLGEDEYYFYYDVNSGEEVNILKVLKTNNGNLLM